MKAAADSLVKIADFKGTVIDFRPARAGLVETQFSKRDDGLSPYIEGDLIDSEGVFYPNVRVFQGGLMRQLKDEMGEWVGGLLTELDTGKGNPMLSIDGKAVTPGVAKQFAAYEEAAPDFNDQEAPF
jgi:hypothetical protein